MALRTRTVYRGWTVDGSDTPSERLVTVERSGDVWVLTHRVRHSPTGMNWGYGGSGPADLAFSLLWEHLGGPPVASLYQDFKWQYVARWPQDGSWEITDDEIEEFIKQWRSQHPDRDVVREPE
jgi:hypothetical protein